MTAVTGVVIVVRVDQHKRVHVILDGFDRLSAVLLITLGHIVERPCLNRTERLVIDVHRAGLRLRKYTVLYIHLQHFPVLAPRFFVLHLRRIL